MKNNRVREISASEFKEELISGSVPRHFKPKIKTLINGHVDLKQSEILSIGNCTFSSSVTIDFDNQNTSQLISFTHCKINGFLLFKSNYNDLEYRNFSIHLDKVNVENIVIQNLTVKNLIIESGSKLNHLSIQAGSIIEKIESRNSKINRTSIANSVINKNTILRSCDLQDVSILESTINGGIIIEDYNLPSVLRIHDSQLDDLLIFLRESDKKNTFGKTEFELTDCRLKRAFTVTKEMSTRILIDSLNVRGTNSGQIFFNGFTINSILLNDRGDLEYEFYDCLTNNFNCIKLNRKLHLFGVSSIGENSAFKIRYSSLNQAYFFDVDLQSFSKLNFEKSDLSNFSNCQINWFHDDQIDSNETDQIKKFAYKRELYRQLKNNQEKQGDRIKALEFQSKEMHYFRKEKKLSGKKESNRRHWWEDYVILNIGRINNHGQSFFKPILFLGFVSLGFTFLLHAPEIISKISIPFDTTISNETKKLAYPIINPLQDIFFSIDVHSFFKIWISTLNPVHDISEIYENVYPHKRITFYELAIDFLLKVSEAILIFQIIVAFRKYVRQ